jgi:hypothetical protein
VHSFFLKIVATLERIPQAPLERKELISDCIRKIVYELDCYPRAQLQTLEIYERYLRNLVSGKKVLNAAPTIISPDHLKIGSIYANERCLGACDYCSINALPTDAEMPVEMMHEIMASDSLYFDRLNHLKLKDGEIIIHRDPRFAELVVSLIVDYGLPIRFTTAGLLPQNQEQGRLFFQTLSRLGPYADDIFVSVSFNFLNPIGRSDPKLYIGCVLETLQLIAHGIGTSDFWLIIMHSLGEGDLFHSEALESIQRVLRVPLLTEQRLVERRVGRALRNYSTSSPATDKTCYSSLEFGVRANGDISNNCSRPGTRGTSFGNIYENDARQVKAVFPEFVSAHRQIRAENPGANICELHRNMNLRLRPPTSNRPLVRPSVRSAIR